ncbi:MAG: cysteine desulfurase [Chloroflexota bacterium]|nr:MAG: cysteine desulfurase [Chloroflexota bacterium]
MNKGEHIYMDHGASTPVRDEVIEAMLPFWSTRYGNPAAVHRYGQEASHALERARSDVARVLNANPEEIVFTGCGSESDNLALRGAMFAARKNDAGNHLITSIIEHKAVLDTAIQLRDLFDFDLTILPVDGHGQVDPGDVEAAIRPDTVLVSIMAANNEIGTLQPIGDIGGLVRQHGALFHTDAIQAAAVTNWDMRAMPVDLLSLAPHKFYGPKGIGILYVRQNVELVSTLTGGGQENGRRAGTVNVPFAVGAAKALALALEEKDESTAQYARLTARLTDGLLGSLPGDCIQTGHPIKRLPHNASFAFRDLGGNDLLIHLDLVGISASSGSACLTGDPQPSAILEALGLGNQWTKGGLRLTVGRQNTLEHVDYVLETIPTIVNRLGHLTARYT